ncbi:hypothetical protein [Spirosoma validum]|uniref:Uncharacterized protein n=1 Tax=Spirosoma validum TaxID=2771355 RepID=A0A927B7Q2_9BACT|nr:hypothetical protein [Spirosoma validum]MBD2756899.1 hypothetical protein [Spirosoma validum]
MTDEQRQELIEKREQGTLTADEYQQYMNLLENDPDFADQLALHQLLSSTARQEADEELWIAAAEPMPVSMPEPPEETKSQPGWWLIVLNHPLARRAALGLVLIGIGFLGYWVYQRNTDKPPIAAELPVYNEETGEEGLGFGSDDDSPNRLMPVLISRQKIDSLKEGQSYYAFMADTLRLYLPKPETETIKGWQVRYDPTADTYQLIRPGQLPVPLRMTVNQIVPLR